MRGRALGRGRLVRKRLADGQVIYVGDFIGADRVRHRQSLSSDRRVAERMLADLVRKRDLVFAGMGSEEGLDRTLDEMRTEYLSELRTRTTSMHVRNTELRLGRILGGLGARTVREIPQRPWCVGDACGSGTGSPTAR